MLQLHFSYSPHTCLVYRAILRIASSVVRQRNGRSSWERRFLAWPVLPREAMDSLLFARVYALDLGVLRMKKRVSAAVDHSPLPGRLSNPGACILCLRKEGVQPAFWPAPPRVCPSASPYPSIPSASTQRASSARMAMCWGQARSQAPQPMHSVARLWPCLTTSQPSWRSAASLSP